MPEETSFGANLRAARLNAGLTQFDIKERLGFTRTTPISLWERSAKLPEPETIEKLAAAVGVSTAELMAGVVTPYDRLRGHTAVAALDDVRRPSSSERDLTASEARLIDHLRRLPRELALRFGTLIEESALYADPSLRRAPDARYRRELPDTPAAGGRARGTVARRPRRRR